MGSLRADANCTLPRALPGGKLSSAQLFRKARLTDELSTLPLEACGRRAVPVSVGYSYELVDVCSTVLMLAIPQLARMSAGLGRSDGGFGEL